MCFLYDGKFYDQMEGAAIGSSPSHRFNIFVYEAFRKRGIRDCRADVDCTVALCGRCAGSVALQVETLSVFGTCK